MRVTETLAGPATKAGDVLVRELERFVLGGVCAADNGDLVVAGIGAAGNANALALEETIGEPACAVGAA